MKLRDGKSQAGSQTADPHKSAAQVARKYRRVGTHLFNTEAGANATNLALL